MLYYYAMMCYAPLTYERTQLEVMLRWIHIQPMKTPLKIFEGLLVHFLLLHHKRNALWLIGILIGEVIWIWSLIWRVHVLFTLFVFVCALLCQTHIVWCFLFCLSSSCVLCLVFGGIQHILCCVFVLIASSCVLCLVFGGIQHILCCVFACFPFVSCVLCMVLSNTYCVVFLFWWPSSCDLCTHCDQFLWIVHSRMPLKYMSGEN